ncbi:MAG: FCD domain-containing protein [Actinobacteria bacterium]|nr:FCD domain-containing protein [Actinomycetota bacterium]
MTQSWEPVRKIRTHEQVLAQVEQKILDGQLRVGEKLPSERELVEALGVSRTSVREALRALEAMGIIEAGTGSGKDSGSIISGRSTAALSNLLRLHMALAQISLTDLVEVRVQLETNAAESAARNRDESDIRDLRLLVEKMCSREISYEEFNEVDTEFHVRIARASRNALASDLMQTLRDAVRTNMTAVFEELPNWREVADGLAGEHEKLVDAIEQHDEELAAQLVSDHITRFYHNQVVRHLGSDSRRLDHPEDTR